jgi:rod shape-determining protein MreC
MLKRPHFIALGLVALLALIILNLPHQAASHIKLAIGGLFLPLFGLSKSSQQLARQAGDAVTTRAELLRQNEQLRRTNQALQLLASQADATLQENNRLRDLLNWQRQSPWNDRLRLASVIARDPANWWQIVQIDLGSRDGIKTDLPVLGATGELVGRVSSVSLTRSEVMLVGDANCRISARIEKNGQTGIIIGGASTVDHTLVTLSYLSGVGNAKPGQSVVTSGMGIFPGGIRVGQLAEESHMTEQGFAEVTVKLWADPGALDEVWVLLQ